MSYSSQKRPATSGDTKFFLTVSLMVGLVCGLKFLPSEAWAWQTALLNGTAADSSDEAHAVIVTATGDVVAAGQIDNADVSNDFSVVKLSGASGTELWRYVLNGAANGNDVAVAVAADTNENIVAVGWISDLSIDNTDFSVIKLNGVNGTELWRNVLNGAANRSDAARAIAVDATGNVVAVGYTQTVETPPSHDFTVVKLSGATGTELWRYAVHGSAGSGSAEAVAVDAEGNVIAAGGLGNSSTSFDFTVVKLRGSDGQELWRQEINGDANSGDSVSTVAVTTTGDVIAAGRTSNLSIYTSDFTVIKLSGTSGTPIWRYVIDGTPSGGDLVRAVKVDAVGDAVAVGYAQDADSLQPPFTVVKLSGASGSELWRQVIKGTASDRGIGNAVGVNTDGSIVAAGWTKNVDTGFSDFTVVKLAKMTGNELWRKEINGVADGADSAKAVAMDSANDVIAGGGIVNTSNPDFFVTKLKGTDGSDFTPPVCGNYLLEPSEQCDDGNTLDGDCCSSTCQLEQDGSSCSDGNVCTQTDTCQAGVCTGSNPILCSALDQCHEAGTCDPASGFCSHPQKPNGSTCDDSLFCTVMDTCQEGSCEGQARSCGDDNICTLDICDEASAHCLHPAAAETVSCEADNASCTLDHCDGQGQCVFGQQAPPPCVPHDLAVVEITAPKRMVLTSKKPSQTNLVKVRIQNRSPHEEVISTPDMLKNLLTLTVESLGDCVAPESDLRLKLGKVFPIHLAPKQKLSLSFDVTFSCSNDPQKGTGHEDYSYHATVHHEALDGNRDTYPPDNICPRDALGRVPNPDGKIEDNGCGGRKADKTLGAEILTDINAP